MDGLALVLNLQRFAVIAFAFALVARHVDIRQEVHFNLDHAVALARFAAAAAHVKAETSWRIAAGARFRHTGKQFTYGREDAGIGCRVRARGTANRALVNVDNFIEMLQTLDVAVRRRLGQRRAVQRRLRNREQRIVDQRRFTGTGHAGDAGKQANRQRQGDVFQVVAARAGQLQHFFRICRYALFRHLNLTLAAHELTGQRLGHRHDVLQRPFRDHLAAVYASARANVDDVVSRADRIFIVLDHDHRVAEVAQVDQRAEQALVVALVQADGRLIQHVHHAYQTRANLACQTDTLGFTAGERFCRAGKRQVVQADVHQELQAIANLFQHFFGDFRALARELQVVEEVHRVADAHV